MDRNVICRNVVRNSVIALTLVSTLLFTQFAHAARLPHRLQTAMLRQQAQQAAVTGVPEAAQQVPSLTYPSPEAEAQARLASAHTLFIANDGADDAFPRTTDGYQQFVAAMHNWGRYRLVSSIAEADLVLQLRSATTTTVVDGTTDAPSATVYTNPYFKLTVADPTTLRPIWVVTVPVRTGVQKKSKTDLFAQSVENTVSQVKLLAGTPLSSEDQAALRAANTPARRISLPLLLLGIAVVVTVPLVLFEVGKAHGKASQDAFCKANNIPLSMCAGG